MKRGLFLLLISLAAPNASDGGITEPEPIPPLHLFTYPSGSTPERISNRPPGSEGEDLYVGFGAVAPTGAIYFYDLDYNNIKVLDPDRGALLQLIEGPDMTGIPRSMAVGRGGIVGILTAHSCCRFFWYSPKSGQWFQLAASPESGIGIRGIHVGPGGEFYARINDADAERAVRIEPFADPPFLGGFPSAWERAVPGMIGRDGLFYEQRIDAGYEPGPRAEYGVLIRDRKGTMIRRRPLPGIHGALVGVLPEGLLVFERMSDVIVIRPPGEIIAVGTYPDIRTTAKEMLGPKSLLVSPLGRAYRLYFTARGLEVYLLAGRR